MIVNKSAAKLIAAGNILFSIIVEFCEEIKCVIPIGVRIAKKVTK